MNSKSESDWTARPSLNSTSCLPALVQYILMLVLSFQVQFD